jgi:hypothetical protein
VERRAVYVGRRGRKSRSELRYRRVAALLRRQRRRQARPNDRGSDCKDFREGSASADHDLQLSLFMSFPEGRKSSGPSDIPSDNF